MKPNTAAHMMSAAGEIFSHGATSAGDEKIVETPANAPVLACATTGDVTLISKSNHTCHTVEKMQDAEFEHDLQHLTAMQLRKKYTAAANSHRNMLTRSKRRGNIVVDTSNVGLSNGEYKQNELQRAADDTNLTNAIVYDILSNAYSAGRTSALVFAAGVEHAQHISECFAHYGVEVPAVHSKMEGKQRDSILRDFKAGRYWGMVGNNIFTTGFDHPPVDFIACIRPTTSTGLWVQMLGRGTRPSFGKANCLVHDYAGNTERLGPINDPVIPQMKGAGGGGQAPVWCCPKCGAYNHARAPFCEECGTVHDMTANYEKDASNLEVMVSETPIVEMFEVNRVYYYRHVKRADPHAPPLLRVRYACGVQSFDEYIALEATGPRRAIARGWWKQRFNEVVPDTVDQALEMVNALKTPRRINVHINKKYPEIVGVEF